MPIEGELTAPDDSLRSELETAFADTGGGDAGSDGSGGGDISVPLDGARAEVQTDAGTETRARDASGKFVPKPEGQADTTKAAPEKVAAATDSPSTDAAKASTEAPQPAAAAPPAGWTAAEKAEWAKLPPAVQAAVSRREAEMSNGGKQWSDEKRRYETVLSPVAEAARRNGLSTEQGLQSLLNAQSFLERDPTAAIKWLAESHGVNLATLAGQTPAEGSSATPQTPDIQAMVRQIVNQTVAPIVAPIRQRWQADEQRQQDMTVQAVNTFATSPGHEHWNAVENTIAPILPQIIEENPSWSNDQKLQEAYDRALYATPATRQAVLAAKESAAEEVRRTEAAARATRARGAAVSVTGAPSGSAAPEAAGSLREEILRAMTG